MTRVLSCAAAIVLAAAIVAVSPRLTAQTTPQKGWDVAAELGPTAKLAFDTSEGTWMNVDVSPDGERIVFDLLGDIYMMPIDGTRRGARRRG